MIRVQKNGHSFLQDTRETIAKRCERVTQAINEEFWNGSTDISHSFYVGSYGRHTAISTSDVDILLKLPQSEYDRYDLARGNGQSRLLQAVKGTIESTYANSDVHADGQVVVINFSDGVKFELLPAFEQKDIYGQYNETYTYPDTNMGGHWKSTDPKAEIHAMEEKNDSSHGLFNDTCKHLRYIRDTYYTSYHLSGIVIDTFIYYAMGTWGWTQPGGTSADPGTYEKTLLEAFNRDTYGGLISKDYWVPGSNMLITPTPKDTEALGKVLKKIVEG